MHQQLRQKGINIARKRVARLMREMGLKARVARICRRTPGITRFYAKHQNLLLGKTTINVSSESLRVRFSW
ncbi:IS3 family transposase [Marinospirillum alkalitolerans]|uniref:IS3 family transposase n=1 Tax=Marinospirillum alkalitolerans TaxID=3123374 RepID=UPI00386976C1